ncbi:MAG: hypothetical protein AAFV37_14905 [Pseudomonadota bacterium]
MGDEHVVSLWLKPCSSDGKRFQPVIDQLAEAQGVPRFPPHMSLGSITDASVDFAPLLTLLTGLSLSPIELDATPVFTKSLFVRFEISDQLAAARSCLEMMPGFRSRRDFDPHISLCYGKPVATTHLSSAFDGLLSAPVDFDRLQLMRVKLPVETHADVAAWTALEHFAV